MTFPLRTLLLLSTLPFAGVALHGERPLIKAGRETRLVESESTGTWLEVDPSGALILYEGIQNDYSGTWKKEERWRRPGPKGALKALLFQDDGQLKYADK